MVTNPGAHVEETILEIIQQAQLTQWKDQLIFGKNIRHFEDFGDFKDLGLPPEDLKKLRNTAISIQKRVLNSRVEPKMVYVQNTNSVVMDSHSTAISKDQIKLMEPLGEGTFAVVKRAIWCRNDGRKIDVAVKILRDTSPLVLEELKVEAGHLLKLKHPNLIQLYGVVQQSGMMVFELCEGGALLDRLRDDKKPIFLLTTMLDYCLQIVKAMSYLEKEHCVHRDLAARNILLTSDEKTLKICDFGLMRNLKENEEMYIMGPQKRVPFSWCPPEALKHRKFSHASDVWAFGVTVWEIFSLGEEPWIGCRAIDVLKRLDAGDRLEKPAYCSQQIYDIVDLCWKVNPEHRPKFTQLKGYLQEVKFNLVDVRESQQATDFDLGMTSGDQVIVVDNVGVTWYGQNMRTTKFGSFQRASVFVRGATSTKPVVPAAPVVTPKAMMPPPHVDQGNARISRPIKGSLIHTGHFDARGGSSWGQPGIIDDIYLKNAIAGVPLEPGIPLTVPSVIEKPLTPTREAPLPPKPNNNNWKPMNVKTNFDPTKPDWGDFDAAQAPSFSPSKIELPPIPPGAFTNFSTFHATNVYNTPKGTKEPEARPVIPSHQHFPPQSQMAYNHSHPIIFPSGTSAATLNIGSNRPNPPLVSSQTAQKQTTTYNNFNRPPLQPTQAIPRPSNDKKEISIIRPIEYKNSFNGPNRPVLTPTTAPSTSQSTPKQLSNSTVDKSRNVINELSTKLQPSGGGPSHNRPVHQAPLNSSASDPFVVSAAVKEIGEQKRYNETMEKVSVRSPPTMLQPNQTQQRPHSTIGGTNGIPCLIPTQPAKATPVQSNPSVRPSIPVVTQPPPSTIIPSKPLTVAIPEKKEERPHLSSVGSTNQVRVRTQHQEQPKTTVTPAGSVTITPAGTLPRGRTEVDRQSRIEEEIASVLPPPSALFYGGKEDEISRPSTSAPPRPHSVTGVSFPNVLPIAPSISTSTPVKPVDPLPISLHNVLQPIKLHSTPTPPPQAPPISDPPRNIDMASIMNAYNSPVYPMNPPPGYYPSQVPLFALNGPAVRSSPLPITLLPYNGGFAVQPSRIEIREDEDIVAALDPLSIRTDSIPDRAAQMEVLYKEASFVDPAKCDNMVKICNGDIEMALKELKMEFLVETSIAKDKAHAWSSLNEANWDLNRAAERLL